MDDRNIFKFQRNSSVTRHVSPKNPISEVNKKITSTKFKMLPWNIFPHWFGHKNWTYWFLTDFYEKSGETDFSKVMLVLISKGLKHLNTVLYSLYCAELWIIKKLFVHTNLLTLTTVVRTEAVGVSCLHWTWWEEHCTLYTVHCPLYMVVC